MPLIVRHTRNFTVGGSIKNEQKFVIEQTITRGIKPHMLGPKGAQVSETVLAGWLFAVHPIKKFFTCRF